MRPFEIASTAALIATALVWGSGVTRKARVFWVLLCMLLLVLHVVLEGAHWQQASMYLAFVVLVMSISKRDFSSCSAIVTSTFIVVLCLASLGVSFLIPMFSLPKPTGAYLVGTRVLYLRDD